LIIFFSKASPGVYNHDVDENEHSVDEWKKLIFDEVSTYEREEIEKFSQPIDTTSQ
jgi:hypothetical protein